MSSESGLQKHARSLFKAGFSLLQQVSSQKSGDSSDDECSDIVENEDYINTGQRGIIVFKTYSVKSDRHKVLHLNLYKAQVVQYYENKKRTYQCDEFYSITRNSDNNVLIEIRKPLTLQTHYKKIIFESDQQAHQFHQYIDFINESGKNTKAAFNQIDYKKTGIISCPDLRKALARVDLKASEQDIINMMAMGTGKDGVFDYSDFIGMFFDSFVSNLRQCLQEWLIQATASSTDTYTSLAKVDTSLDALPGEVIAFAPTERVYWCIYGGKHCKYPQHIPGVMYATNYRIVLFALRKASYEKASHSRFDVPSFFNMISIPLTTLHRIYFAAPRNSIYLVCKDHRTVRITLSGFENSRNKVETFVQVLQGISFYNVHSLDPRTHLFAYKNLTYFSNNEQGWNLCDLIKEYVRQGLFDSPDWKVLENKEYSLADTYPRYLVLPALMTKDEIRVAAGFRSKARLPVVTYLHGPTGAVLTRSAQPMVGLGQKNCAADAKLLNLYRCKGKALEPKCEEDVFSRFCILDARGKVAATLNMAVGKGTEDISQYQNAELIFCNIDNIHVMRTSAQAFADALSASAAQASGHKDRESQLLFDGSQAGYYARIEDSGWLRHVRLILLAGVVGAEKLHFEGTSVLVHCSDGWDRTAQICGVTQVLLDPFFRTIEGFATLVEKEWCAFGHKFQDRCGHGQMAENLPDERSPVFLQFLDVLYQLLVQFPTAFEFTDTLLLFLADHLNSCLFGNFLGNSEKERIEDLDVRTLTKSLWSYVFGKRNLFVNTRYAAFEKPIWPACGAASIQVWNRFWLRWDSSAHPNNLADAPWHDDWGNGAETDPNLVVKRSSYSYVSKSAASATSGGQSAKRPLGVRHLMPTQNSDSSLNSHFTSSSVGVGVGVGAVEPGTPGKLALNGAGEGHQQQHNQDEPGEQTESGGAAEAPMGLDETLEEEAKTTQEASLPATDAKSAEESAKVPEDVLKLIEPLAPVDSTVAVQEHLKADSSPPSTSSSAAFADLYTTADNAVTLEYVTTASLEDMASPKATGTESRADRTEKIVQGKEEETSEEVLEEVPELPDVISTEMEEVAAAVPASAEVSREEDEDEEFQVMHDRGAAVAGHSPNHRHFRIKRSVDSTTGVTFADMYDISEHGTPVSERRSPVSYINADDVAASIVVSNEHEINERQVTEDQDNFEQAKNEHDSDADADSPTTGDNVAFV